jgi:hypothetical protein
MPWTASRRSRSTPRPTIFSATVRASASADHGGGQIFLVDLLPPLPLDGLWTRLATKHLIMHGSDFDLRLLYDFCEFTRTACLTR